MSSFGAERITLAVDIADEGRARELIELAQEAGACRVKMGLQALTALGTPRVANLIPDGMNWVADQKLGDIGNTSRATIEAYTGFDKPPEAITMHTTQSLEAMELAQQTAGDIMMLGVTALTDISEAEHKARFGSSRLTRVQSLAGAAADVGVMGVVAAPTESRFLAANSRTRGLHQMIPGSRSFGAQKNDQKNTLTPAQAILDGADWLVIGRQITQSTTPSEAFSSLTSEVMQAEQLRERLLQFRMDCLNTPGLMDPEGVHHEFKSGMHGQKLDYDAIEEGTELFDRWAKLYLDFIMLGYEKQPDLVMSVAEGVDQLVKRIGEFAGSTGPDTLLSKKLADKTIVIDGKAREQIERKDYQSAVIVEDVGTTGRSSLMVAQQLRDLGIKKIEVINTWQRRPHLEKLEEAGVAYRSLNFEPLTTFSPDECRAFGFCSKDWEFIPRAS